MEAVSLHCFVQIDAKILVNIHLQWNHSVNETEKISMWSSSACILHKSCLQDLSLC